MIYILLHKTADKEISRYFIVNKEAQSLMWDEYNRVRKNSVDKVSGNRGGDWCEIIYSDKTKETWNIYSLDIPKTEKICVIYKTGTGIVYFITKKEFTIDDFFIYQYNTNTSETIKLGKGNNPILLEQKFIKNSF